MDWSKEHVMDLLTGKFLDESWKSVLPLPAADAEETPMPSQPSLTVLQWSQKVKISGLSTVRTPDKIVRQWGSSPTSGAAFMEFLQGMRGKYALDLPMPTEDGSRKRDSHGQFTPGASSKKVAKSEPAFQEPASGNLFNISDLPTPFCYEAVTMEKHAHLVICPGNRAFIVNKSKSPVMLRAGTVMAGWFKGKWHVVRNGAGGDQGSADIPFHLESSKDCVLMGSSWTSLAQIISAKRVTSPADAIIGFHDLTDSPTAEDSKAFTLTKKGGAALYFRMDNVVIKEGEGTPLVPAQHLAGLVPYQTWDSWCTALAWSVRWPPSAQKGLTPIRPFVVISVTTTIPPEKAVELSAKGQEVKPETTPKEEGVSAE